MNKKYFIDHALRVVQDSSILYKSSVDWPLLIVLDQKFDQLKMSPVPFNEYREMVERYNKDEVSCLIFQDTLMVVSFNLTDYFLKETTNPDCMQFINGIEAPEKDRKLVPLPPSSFQPEVFLFEIDVFDDTVYLERALVESPFF